MSEKVYEFWQEQALQGDRSGTKDFILDILEQRALEENLPSDTRLLEIGCGNGLNAVNLKQKNNATIDAFDYSEEMIKQAKINMEKFCLDINFFVHDLREISNISDKYETIISKRALINLSNTEEQISALGGISSRLEENGRYFMCESSLQGLNNINTARQAFGLDQIMPPWHNTYVDEDAINEHSAREFGMELEKRYDFSSLYYFMSRVVNANLAKINSSEPSYDAPCNKMALEMDSFGDFGQAVLWIWKKSST
jgi:ubiquinone/menaquinone biosynthesis C-methylase UbiE